jgi:hypothetical protein
MLFLLLQTHKVMFFLCCNSVFYPMSKSPPPRQQVVFSKTEGPKCKTMGLKTQVEVEVEKMSL